MNILVTGGNGFLGSVLVKELVLNNTVFVLEKNSKQLHRLQSVIEKIKIYNLEEVDYDCLFRENKIELIIHTATLYGKTQSNLELIYSNFYSPIQLLLKAIQYKVKYFINTDTILNKYVSSYSITKNHFREWLFLLKNEINIINIKLEHIYGFNTGNDNFIKFVILSILQKKEILDLTRGEQKRNFVHIDDVKSAFLVLISSLEKMPKGFNEFEVSSDKSIVLKDLVMKIKGIMKSNIKLNFGAIAYREFEVMESKTNSEKIMSLGWRPIIDLERGLTEVINLETQYYKENSQLLK